MPYERKGIVKIEEVLPFLHCITGEATRKYLGEEVRMGSQRYRLFNKNLTCVTCGLTGAYFALERSGNVEKYHLNLYAVNEDGNEVLMTKDHIIPRSKGGRNILKNYQTMCTKCNSKKSDTLPGQEPKKENLSVEERRREKRRRKRRAYRKRKRARERAKKEAEK